MDRYNYMQAYGTSKLAVVMMSAELSRRLPPNVHTYCVDPGLVRTDLFRENPGYLSSLPVISSLYKLAVSTSHNVLFKSPAQGAFPIIYTATDSKADNETGLYYGDGFSKKPSDMAIDESLAKSLWVFSCDSCNLNHLRDKTQL